MSAYHGVAQTTIAQALGAGQAVHLYVLLDTNVLLRGWEQICNIYSLFAPQWSVWPHLRVTLVLSETVYKELDRMKSSTRHSGPYTSTQHLRIPRVHMPLCSQFRASEHAT